MTVTTVEIAERIEVALAALTDRRASRWDGDKLSVARANKALDDLRDLAWELRCDALREAAARSATP